jgi:hypothetical protein
VLNPGDDLQDLVLSLEDDLLPEVATVNSLILKSLEYCHPPQVSLKETVSRDFLFLIVGIPVLSRTERIMFRRSMEKKNWFKNKKLTSSSMN